MLGKIWKSCFTYIDDVLVCSQTFEEHLRQVFCKLHQAGLRLKAQKCMFLREEVPYLGHVVVKNGIKPSKTEKMKNYPVPKDVNQDRQFLGLASYYWRFVSGFARIASPLHAEKGCCVQLDYGMSGCICSVEKPAGECPSPSLSSISLQTHNHP